MSSSVQEAPAPTRSVTDVTADVVGNAFVHQYYHILHKSPEHVFRFYQDVSKLGRPEQDGTMSKTTTMQAIDEKILSLHYGDLGAAITTVDAQESYNGGVLVLVTGNLTGKDNVSRKFTQTFFLAPQDKGYFVLNDVFRYVEEATYSNQNQGLANNVVHPVTADQGPSNVPEYHVSGNIATSDEEENVDEVCNPCENGDDSVVEEESPEPEVVDESPNDSQVVVEAGSKIEEVPKKSYASIVKVMKGGSNPPLASVPASVRSVAKVHEQKVNAVPPALSMSEIPVPSSNVAENGTNTEGAAEGYSIYIKGLPLNATEDLLENEFKRFGPIKSNGIQVRSQKGVCFGFVEFEVANAVHSAIEASPLVIGGRNAIVEAKKSTSRGYSRGRFSSGRGGGFRGEGMRGRGNYGGGRGYSRGDFVNRAEFGNRGSGRGGYTYRGGDMYQRADKMGNSGGPINRLGVTVNEAPSSYLCASICSH